jgi:hypothetical protein
MRTLIPTSDDDLNEEFFAAWFDTWGDPPEDFDPADAFAIYCAF